MADYQKTLIRIVTEAALENALIDDIERLGAHGYTVADVRGKGSRGARDADWNVTSNIRLEVICDADVAQVIVSHLKQHYYDNYAMIIYLNEVTVLRPDKF